MAPLFLSLRTETKACDFDQYSKKKKSIAEILWSSVEIVTNWTLTEAGWIEYKQYHQRQWSIVENWKELNWWNEIRQLPAISTHLWYIVQFLRVLYEAQQLLCGHCRWWLVDHTKSPSSECTNNNCGWKGGIKQATGKWHEEINPVRWLSEPGDTLQCWNTGWANNRHS